MGWSPSRITDDIDFGIGVRNYWTKHFPPDMPLYKIIKELDATFKAIDGVAGHVIRRKIELVLHDVRGAETS